MTSMVLACFVPHGKTSRTSTSRCGGGFTSWPASCSDNMYYFSLGKSGSHHMSNDQRDGWQLSHATRTK